MDSASKVKIEYTDSSDVFPQFERELNPRLPLKDLHWSSSSRPTRSIRSLHIDLTTHDRPKPKPASSSAEVPISDQSDGVSSKNEGPSKERRHQIPGLRRTPYLKVYLLSCSDIETYKASYRKYLRDWIKDNTPQSKSSSALNKQDNDAFEWLIIHVVPPSEHDSLNQSRPASGRGEGLAEKRPSSSRWPSRNSTSVVEKLRSEFNGTSKTAVDRVAQIQLAEPTSDGYPAELDQRTRGNRDGWDDLMSKLKSLVLVSFDLRVSQYEDDIREREGQKKVFGWNFNTFFVLKEGLAMGFENMGLVEDALTVYRELDFGLKSAVEEQLSEGEDQQTAHFANYTQDLYDSFRQALTLNEHTGSEDLATEERPNNAEYFLLNTNIKSYRDLILNNTISIFEFQCYLFARQLCLSLRLANVSSRNVSLEVTAGSQNDQSNKDGGSGNAKDLSRSHIYEPENLLLLSEIVRSSIEFITSATRTIRQDIMNAVTQSRSDQDRDGGPHKLECGSAIENFAMSWLFSACQCIVDATSTHSLAAQLNPLFRQLSSTAPGDENGFNEDKIVSSEEETLRRDLPVRTSSLPSNGFEKLSSSPFQSFPSKNPLDAPNLTLSVNLPPGLQDLAGERGDLLALKRRVLNNFGNRYNSWNCGVAAISSQSRWQRSLTQDFDLGERPRQNYVKASSAIGLCNAELLVAMKSRDNFYKLYEVQFTVTLLEI